VAAPKKSGKKVAVLTDKEITKNENKKVAKENGSINPHHTKKKRRQKKKGKTLNLLYANVRGARGKIASLQTATDINQSHVVTIVETKGNPPKLKGFEWLNTQSKGSKGGVAIAIREDVLPSARQVNEVETNLDTQWVEIKANNSGLFIGTFYGKQETCSKEENEEEFSKLTTQIKRLQQQGEVILTGDFNAKLEVQIQGTTQEESTRGTMLKKLIEETDMIPVNINQEEVKYTRVNRTNQNEKSVIDYILMTKKIADTATDTEVDEVGLLRIKGTKESDHNTITTKVKTKWENKVEKRRVWNIRNKEGWLQYNKEIKKAAETLPNDDYDNMEKIVNTALHNSIGKVTITTGRHRNHDTKKIREMRRNKKSAKKEIKEHRRKNDKPRMEKAKEKHNTIRAGLAKEIEQNNKKKTVAQIKRITDIKDEGKRRNEIWAIRKKLSKKVETNQYLITEDGRKITGEQETKENVADFYENLFQAREGKEEYKNWTRIIELKVKMLEKEAEKAENIEPTNPKEFNKIIKGLKKGKACGPDNQINEAMIEGDKFTRQLYMDHINKIIEKATPPKQWQESELLRLDKGKKGLKGKCSGERGISLSSNIGKIAEKVCNIRAKDQITISDAQAGGIEGRATTDHIMVLRELIQIATNEKKAIYLTFLDVTKAYDKAWLDAIMYILDKNGIKGKLWLLIKRINENLTARIRTMFGLTRKIKIRDSIRQGGVLAPLMYAVMMDEINKEIEKHSLGIEFKTALMIIGCLLWMDDVVLASTDAKEMQRMLNITDNITQRYHIEFGESKTKTMVIGKTTNKPQFTIGEMKIQYTDKYQYLGNIFNEKNNLQDHLSHIKGKVEAAYQIIMTLTGNTEFNEIEMEWIWILLDSCIQSIATYGGETWKPTKKEMTELNKIMDQIIKRVLITPLTTPREALYIETGLLDNEHIIKKNRINMQKRLNETQNSLLQNVRQEKTKGGWEEITEEVKREMNVTDKDMEGKRDTVKIKIKKKIHEKFKTEVEKASESKSKIKFLLEHKKEWSPGKRPEYMNKMTRMQTSIIFRARTRMLKTIDNYKGAFKETTCRGCGKEPETQKHILETCAKSWKATKNITVTNKEIFSTKLPILRNAARKLLLIDKELENLWKVTQKKKITKSPKRKATTQPELRKKKKRKIEQVIPEIDETLAEVMALVRANRANYFARLGL